MHAPTEVHEELVRRLIEAGIPTYVDKPLAYDYAASSGSSPWPRSAASRWPSASTGGTRPPTASAWSTRAT